MWNAIESEYTKLVSVLSVKKQFTFNIINSLFYSSTDIQLKHKTKTIMKFLKEKTGGETQCNNQQCLFMIKIINWFMKIRNYQL